ncbi:hypothetical protein DMB38_34485 [Streptomyces sp. WAC 06738]|uniref:hypothetical protein n=1 Tax=Streptomyces sp. WAC 06738 TaxID=2203210 RepID=UPI000F6DBF61|nr:hypothetical protein [Streptomyces sp. WAC 06738]AZM50213.1 hypothetical protein DMB38_34485 [Streptomyces sp. WAC 06738]
MKLRTRITRGLGAVLLLGGALLSAVPSAAAAEATPAAAAEAELIPPTLEEAFYSDPWVKLHWEPSATAADTEFINILADGKQVQRLDAKSDAGAAGRLPVYGGSVNVDTTGADPTATYTIVAEDAAGNKSAPSNGLVPIDQSVPLPAPTVTSAVIKGDDLTVTWTPTVSEADFVNYGIVVNGRDTFAIVGDTTSVTGSRTFVVFENADERTVVVNEGDLITVGALDSNGLRSPRSEPVQVTLG